MAEKIIKTLILPSGRKATAYETASNGLALEIGSGCIFLSADDIYMFTRLLKEVDEFYLRKP